jgi:hypothetical protein
MTGTAARQDGPRGIEGQLPANLTERNSDFQSRTPETCVGIELSLSL